MQELTFPEISDTPEAPFDNYTDSMARPVSDDAFVVLFSRVDANGKHHYMVAERWATSWDAESLLLTNAKEFKHAKDRAQRYFKQRRADLGSA